MWGLSIGVSLEPPPPVAVFTPWRVMIRSIELHTPDLYFLSFIIHLDNFFHLLLINNTNPIIGIWCNTQHRKKIYYTMKRNTGTVSQIIEIKENIKEMGGGTVQ